MLIVISAVAESPWAVEDCSLAAENLMLAASAAGLGTCWIGFAQAWLGTPEGKAALKLSETCVPVAPIIVGHPKSPAPAVPRKIPDGQLDFVNDRRWRAKARVVHSVAFLTRAVTKADFPLANLSFNLPWTVS